MENIYSKFIHDELLENKGIHNVHKTLGSEE